MVAVGLSRLLRRGLLTAALAAAAWLLSAVFAGSAVADELPGDQPYPLEQPSGGLLGGLLDGVTGMVTDLTGAVENLTGPEADATPPAPVAPSEPGVVQDGVPDAVPAPRATRQSGAEAPAPAPAPLAPAPQPAAEVPVTVPAAPAAAAVRRAVVPVPAATGQTPPDAGDQAGRGTDPLPEKAPAGTSTPATMAGPAHDNAGGARGPHGVLFAQAPLAHPADAGFTTRSRAVNAAGRTAGLPAATPD